MLDEETHSEGCETAAASSAPPAAQPRVPKAAARLAVVLSILLVWGVGVFFRSYALFPGGRPGAAHKSMAEDYVKSVLQKQLAAKIQQSMPGMPGEVSEKLASQQIAAVINEDLTNFTQAVKDVRAGLSKRIAPGVSRHYLLEADPYYFLAQTQNLLRKGKVSERIENRKFYDPLRLGPKGFWTPLNYHPYIGIIVYKLVSLVKPVTLMEGVSYTPLVLLLGVAAALYWVCSLLGMGTFSYLGAGFALLLSPIFVQRSSFGWYDNDPYNILFPLLHLAFFLKALASSRRDALIWGGGAGLLTGLFAMFWVGWPFISFLLLGAAMAAFFLGLAKKKLALPGSLPFMGGYASAALFFVMIFSSPQGLLEFVSRGAEFAIRFSSSVYEGWPNVFLTVGEANSVTLQRFIHLTGNKITFAAAYAGLLGGLLAAFFRKDRHRLVSWLTIILMSLPLALLAFRTERFALLITPFIALYAGMAVESLSRALSFVSGRLLRFKWVPFCTRIAAGGMAVAALLPMQLVFAHALALKSGPIMNDAWYDALIYLKNNTPEKSFVQSWWPPGYFITAVAERRVSSDGGTQHLPETYWMARFFSSQDETEALSILRMLQVSGNDAVEYLMTLGMPLEESVALLNRVLSVKTDSEARAVLAEKLDQGQTDLLLSLIRFAHEPDPAYIFIYSEMIEKSLAITLHARWNFVKAREMAKVKAGMNESKDDYVKNTIEISEGILKYRPESKLAKRTETLLAFESGLVVDLKGYQSAILGSDQKVQGQPMSLLYLEDGELKEVFNDALLLDVSALLFERGGQYYSVLADRRLLRSVLFRLFYLEGAGLDYFRPFYEVSNKEADTEIKIFEVLWSPFLKEKQKENA